MSIDALTVVYPPQTPTLETNLQQVTASGGVYSQADNISSVKVVNLNKTPYQELSATLTPISAGDYSWSCPSVPLLSIGLNTLRIIARAADGDVEQLDVVLFVDFTPPTIVAAFPSSAETGVSPLYRILVRFSEVMDVPSTISGISLSPDPGGYWFVGFSDTDFIYSIPGNLLSYGTKYTVSFSPAVRDRLHNSTTALSYSFTTYDAPEHLVGKDKVISPIPLGNIGQVPILIESSGTNTTITPTIARAFRDYPFVGKEKGYTIVPLGHIREIDPLIESSLTYTYVPPSIARAFRDYPYVGKEKIHSPLPLGNIRQVPVLIESSGANTVITPGIQRAFRDAHFVGKNKDYFFSYFNIIPEPWFPVVLSYNIHDVIQIVGQVRLMGASAPVVEWEIPNAMRNRRVYFTVQFSRSPSYYRYIAFDSFLNVETFQYSTDSLVWQNFPLVGVKRRSGFVKFTSPAMLEGGIWYFKILAGYKKV